MAEHHALVRFEASLLFSMQNSNFKGFPETNRVRAWCNIRVHKVRMHADNVNNSISLLINLNDHIIEFLPLK